MPSKEIGPKAIQIKRLPQKPGSKEITSAQGSFDLGVECVREIHGVEMGVLTDGTPFLSQRGLARLCGVQNAHVGTIETDWIEVSQKPRIIAIKDLLKSRGVELVAAHLELFHGGRSIHAFTDVVCLAILEYYAFEAGTNIKQEALKNFRMLAGRALQDFIYAQVGYDPNQRLRADWRAFHDRVSLAYNAVPTGYFSIFKEIADMIVTLGQAGCHIDESFVPDISVGKCWGEHWTAIDGDTEFGTRRNYQHNYPPYFPQAKSNPQQPWCYPESALAEFRRWFREHYIGEGKFKNYLDSKVKQRPLPTSFAQLAIAAYKTEDEKAA
jgi:hypothetical protein